jgi:hypothetical protein
VILAASKAGGAPPKDRRHSNTICILGLGERLLCFPLFKTTRLGFVENKGSLLLHFLLFPFFFCFESLVEVGFQCF